MDKPYQIRHPEGGGFRPVYHCTARGCDNVVRGSWWPTREQAEEHAPKTRRQARCYFHGLGAVKS